jgi:hypothetical protein
LVGRHIAVDVGVYIRENPYSTWGDRMKLRLPGAYQREQRRRWRKGKGLAVPRRLLRLVLRQFLKEYFNDVTLVDLI